MYPGVTRIVSRVSRVKMTINYTVKVHVFLCFKYNYYINRPQGKVIFLETSVSHSVQGGLGVGPTSPGGRLSGDRPPPWSDTTVWARLIQTWLI